MEENQYKIKYFCCEDRIIVRVIENSNGYFDTLEYYDPKNDAWISNESLSKNWYYDMFVKRIVNFKEVSREEAWQYMRESKEYFKKTFPTLMYLRRIYGLDIEILNPRTGEWQVVTNQEYIDDIDDYTKVSEEEIRKYRKTL